MRYSGCLFGRLVRSSESVRDPLIERELGKKAAGYVLRNTKNDISFLLRQAAELSLIKPLPEEAVQLPEKTLGRRTLHRKLPAFRSETARISAP
jgi:hypothetical protein